MAQGLVDSILPDDMRLRPESDCWSVAECLEHLSLSSESVLKQTSDARHLAGERQIFGTAPYKMDKIGRLLNWTMRPPVRIKFRTSEKFQPNPILVFEDTLPRFLSLQEQLKTEIANVEGLDLNRVTVQSLTSKRVRYNLFSCFVLVVT